MNCAAERHAAHRRFARTVAPWSETLASNTIDAAHSPSGVPETELVVEVGRWGTVPDAIVKAIATSEVGLAKLDERDPRVRRVVVR